MILPFFASQAAAWTSAGPWGGVIHDLKNHSAGSGTLYAATGNGLYRYAGSLPWEVYPDTSGYRVLEVVADPARDALYGSFLQVDDYFTFNNINPGGVLNKVTLSSMASTSMGLSDVTALAVCGSGNLLAGTENGAVLRFPSGSSSAQTSFNGSSPIYALFSEAGTNTVYMSRFDLQSSTAEIYVSGSCGNSLSWNLEFSRLNTDFASIGKLPSGEIMAGTDAGQVFMRSGGVWSSTPYGSGLPPYSVVDFGKDSDGNTYALLRNHRWFLFSGNDGPPGLFMMPATSSGSWVRRTDFDDVTSRVSSIASAGGYDWVSFDDSGIRRIAGSGSGPGEEADRGIIAVSVSHIYHDPRSEDRCLTVGSGGIYERRNGQWRRLLFDAIQGAGTAGTLQWIRESGFLSAAISEDDPTVIWIGGSDTGLFRGEQNPAGAWTYQWTWPYWKDTAGFINDICMDPFDSTRLWWATENGIYLSTNDGTSWTQAANSNFNFKDISVELTDPAVREFLAGHSTNISAPGLLASSDGAVWATELYPGTNIGAVEFLTTAAIGGTVHALAGPSLDVSRGLTLLKSVSGSWQYNSQVPTPPSGLPSNPQFLSISQVLGTDNDLRQDVFAIVRPSGGSGGIFSSAAQSDGGLPGGVWTDVSGELSLKNYSVTTVEVHPRNGNLIWVGTSQASCFTLIGTHFTDATDPAFPTGSDIDGIGSTDTEVYISWYAPGDDGEIPGWADRYELRYHGSVFTVADSFSSWGTALSVSNPHLAWKRESMPVDFSSIPSGTNTLAFALRAFDEGGRASQILSTGLLSTLARQPLAGVTPSPSSNQIGFSWSTSGLAGDPYYTNFGKIKIERDGISVVEFSGTQKWTENWIDDIASAGYDSGDVITYILYAEDGAGNAATVRKIITVPGGSTGSGGASGGGGCFIATAAFGSPLEDEVKLLREYRDSYLLNHWWGRVLLKTYYSLSPVPAALISERPLMRAGVRAILRPIVSLCKGSLSNTPLPAVAGVLYVMFLCLLIPVTIFLTLRLSRRRNA